MIKEYLEINRPDAFVKISEQGLKLSIIGY